ELKALSTQTRTTPKETIISHVLAERCGGIPRTSVGNKQAFPERLRSADRERRTLSVHRSALAPILALVAFSTCSCSNDPYPPRDASHKILYTSFVEPPKTLDPAVSYSVTDHAVSGNIFETLLEYHYLKRPYTLIPGLAVGVPEPVA